MAACTYFNYSASWAGPSSLLGDSDAALLQSHAVFAVDGSVAHYFSHFGQSHASGSFLSSGSPAVLVSPLYHPPLYDDHHFSVLAEHVLLFFQLRRRGGGHACPLLLSQERVAAPFPLLTLWHQLQRRGRSSYFLYASQGVGEFSFAQLKSGPLLGHPFFVSEIVGLGIRFADVDLFFVEAAALASADFLVVSPSTIDARAWGAVVSAFAIAV